MIALLRGAIVHRGVGEAVIDVQGVGYRIRTTERALHLWASAPDEDATAHVSTQVSQDAIALYGFNKIDERDAFEVLLGVSGVGPKAALACLDGLDLGKLRRAIETDDIATLMRVKGIGKKTAQRLALELKGKVPASFAPDETTTSTPVRPSAGPDPLGMALTRLGYNKGEIDTATRAVAESGIAPDAPVAERLRAALKLLYRR
jgi:Holliday junction DNA helicase RuvA